MQHSELEAILDGLGPAPKGKVWVVLGGPFGGITALMDMGSEIPIAMMGFNGNAGRLRKLYRLITTRMGCAIHNKDRTNGNL